MKFFIVFTILASSHIFALPQDKNTGETKVQLKTIRVRAKAFFEFSIPEITKEKLTTEVEFFFIPKKINIMSAR